MNDERIDIVDTNDNVLYIDWRLQVQLNPGQYKRVALIFLRNGEKLCFLKRTAHKKKWPNYYAPVGGGVQAGENYEQAFKRELKEETFIEVTSQPFRLLGIVHPEDDGMSCFRACYEVTVPSQEISINEDDFSSYVWLTPQEFLSFAKKELVFSDLHRMVPLFYRKYLEIHE